MEHNPVKVQGRTYTRLEHIVGVDGIRFHYIARYAKDDGDTRYAPNWYRSDNARRGFFDKLFDALKGMRF